MEQPRRTSPRVSSVIALFVLAVALSSSAAAAAVLETDRSIEVPGFAATFSVPIDKGRYRVVYEPPVELPSSGDRDRDVLELTARCTAIIETWVRRYPEQWLWMHRRWKTAPEDR